MHGAQRRFMEISKRLREGEITFQVIEDYPPLFGHCNGFPISLNEKPSPRIEDFLWSLKSFIAGLKCGFEKKPDIILAPSESLYDFLPGYFLSKIFHVPLIQVMHLIPPDPFFRYKSFLFRAANIITVSEAVKKDLIHHGFDDEKIFKNKNGIPLKEISEIEAKGNKGYDAVFVGRVTKSKGIPDLIKSWRKVNEVLPNAKLGIIGEGSYLEKGKKLSKKLGLSKKIDFTGWVKEEEKYRLLKSSDLFVLPSKAEGFPIAIVEALACRTPAIAYGLESLKAYYRDCESVFFVKNNWKVLGEKIKDLLKEDEEKMNELEANARDYSKKFGWDEVADKELKILQEVARTEKNNYNTNTEK